MSKSIKPALQAMQEAQQSNLDVVVLQLDPIVKAHLRSFTQAFEEVSPGNPFSVLDIMGWSLRYWAILQKADPKVRAPAIFNNAYALGKLLKRNQEELGIQSAGTYGNRAIYTVGGNNVQE